MCLYSDLDNMLVPNLSIIRGISVFMHVLYVYASIFFIHLIDFTLHHGTLGGSPESYFEQEND